jgi:mRNA interferase MazF
VALLPQPENGLEKQSIADCLQTRPIDYRFHLIKVRGDLAADDLKRIDPALRIVFGL